MVRFKTAAVGLVLGGLVAIPQGVGAQDVEGWWQWALRDVAHERLGEQGVALLDRANREDGRDGGSTLGDIIFGRDTDGRDRQDRRDRRDRDDDRDEEERYEDRGKRGKGPQFCRNGQGHPVHGRQWCADKGFGLGSRGGVRWEDRGWEDVILGAPRETSRRQSTLDQGGLIDILDDVVLGRVRTESRRLGATGPLEGRWVPLQDGGRVLQIRSGSLPVAELTDLNGDGRVDVALVPRR